MLFRSAVSLLVRLSIPPGTAQERALAARLGVLPEPNYGGQLQDVAIPGHAPEGRVRLSYSQQTVRFADGLQVELQQPELQIDRLGYGPLHPDTQFSVRIAPPMIGLGLLEAIDARDILANADPDDRNGDGISGRANQVWDHARQDYALGRFGWKAGQPTLDRKSVV